MHIEFWVSASIYLAMVNGNGLNKMLPQTFKVETNTERERDRKKAARRLCHTRKITKSYIMNLRDKPKSSHQWQLHHAPPCWAPAANENAPSFVDHLCMGQWMSASQTAISYLYPHISYTILFKNLLGRVPILDWACGRGGCVVFRLVNIDRSWTNSLWLHEQS